MYLYNNYYQGYSRGVRWQILAYVLLCAKNVSIMIDKKQSLTAKPEITFGI